MIDKIKELRKEEFQNKISKINLRDFVDISNQEIYKVTKNFVEQESTNVVINELSKIIGTIANENDMKKRVTDDLEFFLHKNKEFNLFSPEQLIYEYLYGIFHIGVKRGGKGEENTLSFPVKTPYKFYLIDRVTKFNSSTEFAPGNVYFDLDDYWYVPTCKNIIYQPNYQHIKRNEKGVTDSCPCGMTMTYSSQNSWMMEIYKAIKHLSEALCYMERYNF